MPTIQIVDGFGLSIQASPDPVSAFAKYFRQLPSLSVLQHDLASIQNVPLAGFPLKSVEIGLSVNPLTTLQIEGLPLTMRGGVSGVLCVVTDGNLFDPDYFGDPVAIPQHSAYINLGVKASVSPGMDLGAGKLTCGFTAGTTVCLSHYKLFETTSTLPTFRSSLEASLRDYTIPAKVDDLAAMSVGDVATVEGTGTLQFSGNFNLLTLVNPLVSVSAAVQSGAIKIQEGASVDVGASFAVEGEYQIRVQKLDSGKVRIGFYTKRGVDLAVQASASVGISAGTAKVDLISAAFSAISPSPFPSAGSIEDAGLGPEKAEAIHGALQTAIQRRLELAIEGELQALSSQGAAFLYEIDLDALEPEGRAAVQDALRLNLSSLMKSGMPTAPGITQIRNILTTAQEKKLTIKLNILGIYNYSSLTELGKKGTVLTDPGSGEVVVTDAATATRIAAGANFLADSDKLRKLLAQSFLLTAAYRCSKLIAHPPSVRASYWHFASHAQTDRQAMADNLNVVEALGLIPNARKQECLANVNDFGGTTFYINTDYDDALTERLFLQSGGQPRGVEEYEEIGRNALKLLLQDNPDNAYRLRPLTNDSIWKQVAVTGGTHVNLAALFPDLSTNVQIPVLAGDYVLIAWWATTMSRMAKSLATARRFFGQDPPPSPQSAGFAKMQSDLWNEMAEVTANTQDRFAEPWGLLAMDIASGQQSAASAQITSPRLSLKVDRQVKVP